MRDWRKALQSNAMRNVTLAIFVANAVGIYAAQVRMSQPVANGLDSTEAPPALAEREIGADLPALPSPRRIAPLRNVAPAVDLAAALPHFKPDVHFVPDAEAQAIAAAPPEPEFAEVVHDAAPGTARVASVGPRMIAGNASASFTAAFSGLSADARAASADADGSMLAAPTGSPAPPAVEPVLSQPTSAPSPAVGAVPQGASGVELPAIDDHAPTTGAVPAPAAPAPTASGADAPSVVLGA
jgi:hypothetical protein